MECAQSGGRNDHRVATASHHFGNAKKGAPVILAEVQAEVLALDREGLMLNAVFPGIVHKDIKS